MSYGPIKGYVETLKEEYKDVTEGDHSLPVLRMKAAVGAGTSVVLSALGAGSLYQMVEGFSNDNPLSGIVYGITTVFTVGAAAYYAVKAGGAIKKLNEYEDIINEALDSRDVTQSNDLDDSTDSLEDKL